MSTKSNITVQEKMTKLSELAAWFDSDDFVLEKALDVFKQAEELAAEIEKDLNSLKNDINVIKKKFDSES
jgi:exonuclease VII small subunit